MSQLCVLTHPSQCYWTVWVYLYLTMIYTVILRTLNLFGSHQEYVALLLIHVQASLAKIISLFTTVSVLSDACKPIIDNRLGSDQ